LLDGNREFSTETGWWEGRNCGISPKTVLSWRGECLAPMINTSDGVQEEDENSPKGKLASKFAKGKDRSIMV